MSNITPKEAIANLNHIYGMVAPDIQRSLDVAIKAIERPKGEWKTVEGIDGDEYYECSNCGEPWVLMAGTPKDNNMNFCPNCGAEMRKGGKE